DHPTASPAPVRRTATPSSSRSTTTSHPAPILRSREISSSPPIPDSPGTPTPYSAGVFGIRSPPQPTAAKLPPSPAATSSLPPTSPLPLPSLRIIRPPPSSHPPPTPAYCC